MSSTVANLPSGAPAEATDIVYAVKDPSGTPSDSKLALSDIKDYVLAGGGGGSPAGSNNDIQFNDNGAFGASSEIKAYSSAPYFGIYIGDGAFKNSGLYISNTNSGLYSYWSDPAEYEGLFDVITDKTIFGPVLYLVGSKDTNSTQGSVTINLVEPASSAANYDYTLTLPDSPGASGQSLSTNGSGVLSWADPAGNSAPSTASSTGRPGEIRFDSSHIYVCVATDTWKRADLSTW